MVKIIIGNIYSKIVGFLPDPIHAELNKTLSYKVQNARHMPQVKCGKWDGVVRLYHKSRAQSFYTGLLGIVREVLTKRNIAFTKIDSRIVPEKNLPLLSFTPPDDFEERKYQEFTIDRSLKFTRGILEMATGSGKTLVVTKLISEIKTYPFTFFVLTKDLMEQTYNVLSTCLNEPIGLIGDGNCDIKKINVCTIQTAIKALKYGQKIKISDYKFDSEDKWDEKGIENEEKASNIRQLISSSKGVYYDECHHAASSTTRDVLTNCHQAYWRYGGSATPYREDGASILIQGMFGAKIVKIDASYLIKNGYLTRPYIFFEPIDSKVDLHSYQKVYKHCIEENNDLNSHVVDTAKYLMSKGLNVLILTQHYPQGDYIKSKLEECEYVTSRMTSKQRSNAIQDFRDGKSKVMIATSLADEGLDIKNLMSVLIAGGGASAVKIHQRMGRALRKFESKDKAIIVIYEHNARFLKRHASKIRSILKKEKEFVLIDSKGKDFIFEEIGSILGDSSRSKNLFEI